MAFIRFFVSHHSVATEHELFVTNDVDGRSAPSRVEHRKANERRVRTAARQAPHHLHRRHEHAASRRVRHAAAHRPAQIVHREG